MTNSTGLKFSFYLFVAYRFDRKAPGSVKLQERLEVELRKRTEEAESKVAAVLRIAEERGQMIESLHTSVSSFNEAVSFHSSLVFFLCQQIDFGPISSLYF